MAETPGQLTITITAQIQPLIDALEQMARSADAFAVSLNQMGYAMRDLVKEWGLSYRAEIVRRIGQRPVVRALQILARWEKVPAWHPRVIGLWIRSQYDLLPVEW